VQGRRCKLSPYADPLTGTSRLGQYAAERLARGDGAVGQPGTLGRAGGRALVPPRELSEPDPEFEALIEELGVSVLHVPDTGHAMGLQNPRSLAEAVAAILPSTATGNPDPDVR
jgi:hypothetical protein